jgi:hypothetical protein
LALKGSYSAYEQYTITQLKDLQTYAQSRGVRIIPEFDSPGHTFAISYAYPELVSNFFNFGSEPISPINCACTMFRLFVLTRNHFGELVVMNLHVDKLILVIQSMYCFGLCFPYNTNLSAGLIL